MIIKKRAVDTKIRRTIDMRRILILSVVIAVIGFSGVQAFAQTAVLHDGTALTRKQPIEMFSTEGPIWDIDINRKTITVVGMTVTVPLLLDGEPFVLGGTSGIGAADFDRLLDINATVRDVTPERQGATRSIFSTSEVGRTDATSPVTRSASALTNMESNYFRLLLQAYAVHAAHLPINFLDRAGIRLGVDVYPVTSGGVLKSAGHVYLDALGNEYLITDLENVIELAENVVTAPVKNTDGGDPLTGRPASFVMGDLLVIFNQDPRSDNHIAGFAGLEIPLEIFIAEGAGRGATTFGYTVGPHILFAQEVTTDLIDPSLGIVVITNRWQFDDGANEIRIRGRATEANFGTLDELALEVSINDGLGTTVLPGTLLPIIGPGGAVQMGAEFDFRTREDVIVANVTAVTVRLRYKFETLTHAAGAIAFEETILRVNVEE